MARRSGLAPAARAWPSGTLSAVNDPNQPSVLGSVLASVADKMVADFRASGIAQHRGSKGTVRETQFLDNYLRKYLPRNVTAEHSAEVVAANGDVSGPRRGCPDLPRSFKPNHHLPLRAAVSEGQRPRPRGRQSPTTIERWTLS